MPSADQFLQLLEEKDLVSAAVLQAARREIQGSSPPHDAVHLSLWLVQGQHITASQAERLLAAVAEKAKVPEPKPPIPNTFQPKSPELQRPTDQAGKPDLRTDQAGNPDVHAFQPKFPKPQRLATAPVDDLDLAPLAEEVASKAGKTNPAKASSAPQDSRATSSQTSSPAEIQGKKSSATAKISGELESLEDTMKGPLDALIESEALQSTGFDDPTAEMQLNPAVPKKFKLRRFLKNLFRRNKNKSNIVRIKAADPRQVKLVLMSWGVAVFALFAVLTAFWAFSSPGSAELRQEAEEAVMAEDYRKAIGVYDKFLKHYPGTNDIRLLRSLAELRLAEKEATAAGDWTAAVEVAKTQVKSLPKDKERIDSDVLQKFGITLAKIGEGLAQQVQAHPDKDSVGRLQSVVKTLEENIPEINRPTKMLDEMKGILQHGIQEVAIRQELDRTVEAIRDSAKAVEVQAAYTAYHDFVQSNPERTDDVRLTDAMKQVSAVQQKEIKLVEKLLPAARQERPSGMLAAMPLAVQPVKGELAEGRGKLFFVVEQGTAYGLNAATGKTLWRRFVALDPKLPAVTAMPITGPTTSDVVLCDPVHQELLRVQGATGELLWRLVIGQPIIAEPVQAGKWLLLLTKDQRLLLIDPATGDSPRYFQLPQAVRLPPVVDAVHRLIFLVAEHSNLIVLSMDQLDGGQVDKGQLDMGQCRQVFHVGHETGKIAASPAIVGDFLLLPVNDAPSDAKICLFSIFQDKEGEPLMPMQTIRLAGYIDIAPVAFGRGAAVVTAQGSLFVLDQNKAGNKLPFQVVASKPVSLEEKATHYALSASRSFWVADRHLTRYAVHADEQRKVRIVPEATILLGMEFVRPPRIDGGTMFQVLQKSGMPGVTVSAFSLEKKEAVWQTWLAAPLVSEPTLGAGKLTAVTKSGGIFRAPLDGLKPLEKPWEPVLTIDSSQLMKPLSSLLPLPGEMCALTSGGDTTQIVIYDPKEQDKQLRNVFSPKKMSMGPGAFAGSLLTPCVNGQVFLLDPEARGEMAKPLEPAVKGVGSWNWRTPIAVDDKLAVLCDGDSRLMVINISTDTEKALGEVASATTKNGLVSPIAVLGNSVYVVDSTNKLLSFELPNLSQGKSQVLGSRCVWGPQRVGKLVLVATEKGSLPTEPGRLYAINEQQQVVWQSILGHGPLAGTPHLSGDEIFLSARTGMVWRISAADGKELGKVDAGCLLGTGPLVVGSRVIVGGHEGSLLELKKP